MARTIRREEVEFPSAPDPRFGGNLARANVGKQYSRAFPGGPPGVDRRYEDYQAPHRVDYTSPRGPIQTGTPNFRPPSGDGMPRGIEQIPSGNFLQRLFQDLSGQAFGPQGPLTAAVPQDDWRTWDKIIKAGENPDDYEVETSDASDWIDFGVNTGRNVYDMYQGSQFGLDPFEGSIGYDKQFDLPFGGTGNIEADYDLEKQRLKTGIMGNWKWG